MASQFRTFTAGEVLTAANVNAYLMKQAVIVIDSSADLPSPNEGMVVYDKALDATLMYTGSAWVRVANLVTSTAVQTWTPVVTQSGTVAHTANRAVYIRQGAFVSCWAVLTITGSGTTGNNITVTLPVNSYYTDTGLVVGAGRVDDGGTARYIATVEVASANTVVFRPDNAFASAGNGFALANNDTIQFHAHYLAA